MKKKTKKNSSQAQRKAKSKKQTRSAAKSRSGGRLQARANGQSAEGDIITLILEDHKPLKQLIKIMKDSEADENEVAEAFDEFAPMLVNHAKSEEQSLYVHLKDTRDEDLRTEGFEGDVEHTLADQLLEEIPRTEDADEWRAKVKVLAELVEHHIEEEEDEMLPDFRKKSELETRVQLGEQFLRLKTIMHQQGDDDSPSEGQAEVYAPQ